MKSQKELIHNTDWDSLIILDACRYDYFEKIYSDFLDGKLKKVESPDTFTEGWFEETFDGAEMKNTVYISANPHINSRGGNLAAYRYFDKVIDVWDWGWNEEIMTVPPDKVGKAARMLRAKKPRKRLIVHFMQPHYPYLTLESDFKNNLMSNEDTPNSVISQIWDSIAESVIKILGERTATFHRLLPLSPKNGVEFVAEKNGKSELKTVYEKNIKGAFREVKKIVERLPGKKFVTSDHGEFLGENEIYGHPWWSESPILKTVPWLEVE